MTLIGRIWTEIILVAENFFFSVADHLSSYRITFINNHCLCDICKGQYKEKYGKP